ncbi:hypothetical protein D3C77_622730 [compost metagenome]
MRKVGAAKAAELAVMAPAAASRPKRFFMRMKCSVLLLWPLAEAMAQLIHEDKRRKRHGRAASAWGVTDRMTVLKPRLLFLLGSRGDWIRQ